MKIPPNDVLVRAFRRGWAQTVECFQDKSAAEDYRDVLISGGIVEVIRAIEEYKIPPATVDGFQTVEILAKNKRGRTVIVKASVFDGVLSCIKTPETQPESTGQYDYTELKFKDGQFLRNGKPDHMTSPAVDRRFQDILGLKDVPENRFGADGTSRNNVCGCKIEMATFRTTGSLCPHCGNVVPGTTKGD